MVAQKPRTLPHNIDAEQSVLGGVLMRPPVLARLSDLEADDFYDPRNRFIFGAMRALEAKAKPIDAITIGDELEAVEKLEAVGGYVYLAELALRVPTPDNVVHYAKIVMRHRRRRLFMELCSEQVERGYEGGFSDDDDPAVDAAKLAKVMAAGNPAEVLTLGQAVTQERDRIVDLVDRMKKGENVFAGLPLGFRQVDATLGGAPLGSPVLLLGLRGGAKTTLSQCVGSNAAAAMALAKKRGVVVMAFNEDMPPFFAQRRIAGAAGRLLPTESIARLTFTADRTAGYSEGGFEIFLRACEKAIKGNDAGLVLLPVHGCDGDAIARKLLRIHAEFGLVGAVVDYLQRARNPRGVANKVEAIGLNMSELGNVAQEANCALIVNAQLDPGVSDRKWDDGGPIPRLGDTRWSKDPEGDARLVLAIYDRWAHGKPSASGGRTDSQPGNEDEQLRRDVVELHCLKRTMGEADLWWRLQWIRESHLIRDLDPRDVGTIQTVLDPDEYWRRINKPDEGRGDRHA